MAFTVGVTVVCGPPGAGKTSYVQERAERGDLIVDLDALYQAISGLPLYDKPEALLPFALQARTAVIERLSQPCAVRHAWVIAGGARLEERERFARRGAKVVVLTTEAETCIARIAADAVRSPLGHRWAALVHEWWTLYQREE